MPFMDCREARLLACLPAVFTILKTYSRTIRMRGAPFTHPGADR